MQINDKKKYDVIIVGGGAAGLSAAIYSARREMKTLVITREIGGQALLTSDIQNYPGVKKVAGPDLMEKFKSQAEKFGAKFQFEEIKKIVKKGEKKIAVVGNKNQYLTKSVIIASGKEPRKLGVPGEAEFEGKGVSYCATCDAPLFRGKVITIVGGGNSALEAALISSKIAKSVYLIHRRDKFRGEHILIEQVKNAKNIKIFYNTKVSKISGKNFVEKITLKNNQKREIKTDGLIIEIGFVVNPAPIKELVELDKENQIKIDNKCRTSVPGVFAAGDTTNTPYKQIVISAGEGAKAALSAFEYIQEKKLSHGK